MQKRFWVVISTFLLAMLLYIDRILISVAKPEVTSDLALTDKQMGWVLSIFSLGYALFQVPSGMLADKIGSRKALTLIVSIWSIFTAITGFAWNFVSLLLIRFLFGAGEAGAYPSINRTVFSWIPIKERGLITGINFSAGRLGAAFSLPILAWIIQAIGWQNSFYILGGIGLIWAVVWYLFFKDEPQDVKNISELELNYILNYRQSQSKEKIETLTLKKLFSERNVWYLMLQYFANNFTFFFCLTWLFPHLKTRFDLENIEAAFYSAIPLIFGAFGNIFAGALVDFLYKKGYESRSRTITAMLGFLLAAVGLFGSIFSYSANEVIFFLSVAIFGADMTISPSWSTCTDIGGPYSATISGTMNMFGNLGAFITALIFPYLKDWTGSDEPFFFIGVFLNLMGVILWLEIDPSKLIFNKKII